MNKHVTLTSMKKRTRKKSRKHWSPSSDAATETFRKSLGALSGKSPTLESFHSGLASLVQGTSARTKGNSKPKRPPKTEALKEAEKMVDDARTPIGSVLAADETKEGEREPLPKNPSGLGSPLRPTNGQADAEGSEAKT